MRQVRLRNCRSSAKRFTWIGFVDMRFTSVKQPISREPRRFANLKRESEKNQAIQDGCTSEDERTFGTYLHGLFDQDVFRHEFLRAARTFHKLAPAAEFCDWREHRERALDRLVREVGRALDLKTIFKWVGLQYEVD